MAAGERSRRSRGGDPAPGPTKAGAGPRVALDTGVLIALVCGWHEHHEAATRTVEARLQRAAALIVPAHALLEAYAVLTRLPAPHRLAPADALALLDGNFRHGVEVVALTAERTWALLDGAPRAGIHGGRTYDAAIAMAARRAGAHELLTLNLRHFEAFADERLTVTSPTSA